MDNYSVKRNGVVLMVSGFERHADGTLWLRGVPLLNAKSKDMMALGKEKAEALVKAKKWDEIPDGCYAREGLNESDLLIENLDEIRRNAIANRTPAQIERDRIEKMYYEAARIADSDSEDNVSGPMRIRAIADIALAKWRKDYPSDAAEEDARHLEILAEKERDLASGALFYDADGSISPEEQQRIHDEHMKKAAQYMAKARDIRLVK